MGENWVLFARVLRDPCLHFGRLVSASPLDLCPHCGRFVGESRAFHFNLGLYFKCRFLCQTHLQRNSNNIFKSNLRRNRDLNCGFAFRLRRHDKSRPNRHANLDPSCGFPSKQSLQFVCELRFRVARQGNPHVRCGFLYRFNWNLRFTFPYRIVSNPNLYLKYRSIYRIISHFVYSLGLYLNLCKKKSFQYRMVI